jgi:hypothetical protein
MCWVFQVTRYETGGGRQSRFGTDLERFRNLINKRYSGHLGRVQIRVFVIWKRGKYRKPHSQFQLLMRPLA